MISIDELSLGDMVRYTRHDATNPSYWELIGIVIRINSDGIYIRTYRPHESNHYTPFESLSSRIDCERFEKVVI